MEAEIPAASQEWGEEIMTEGDLGELLRATAAAVIAGEGSTLESVFTQEEMLSLEELSEPGWPVSTVPEFPVAPGIEPPPVADQPAIAGDVSSHQIEDVRPADHELNLDPWTGEAPILEATASSASWSSD